MDKIKRNIYKLLLSFLIVGILLSSFSYASYNDMPEPSYEFYVYDQTGIVKEELEKHIIDINKKLYSATGAQVVVAIPKSLGGMDKNTYATALFEKWEIGQKGKDNGILILIAPDEGEIWIEIGYGLEGAIPDSIAKRIIEGDMIPFFREEKYNEGILSGFNQIVLRIEDEYEIDIEGLSIEDTPRMDRVNFNPIYLFLFIMLLIFLDSRFLGGRILRTLSRSAYMMNTGPGRYRGGPPPGGGSGGSSGGGGRSGGGGAGGSW